MQGTVILRALGAFSLAALVAGCHPNTRSTAGETPGPSQTTVAQANSTAAPDQSLSQGPGGTYFATESAGTKGVTFNLWLNGSPVSVLFAPGKAIDITKEMRGHANVVVVQWTRTKKDGSGSLTVRSRDRTVITANVTPSSKPNGKVSKTFIAPQAPVGRP